MSKLEIGSVSVEWELIPMDAKAILMACIQLKEYRNGLLLLAKRSKNEKKWGFLHEQIRNDYI